MLKQENLQQLYHQRVLELISRFRNKIMILNERKLLFYLFFAVLILRSLYVFLTKSHLNGAYEDYEVIANNIVAGNGYSASPGYYWHNRVEPTAMMAPFYTYYYALAKYLFGATPNSYLFIHLGQALVSALSLVLVLKISKEIFDQFTAFLTSLLFLLLPIYSHYIAQSNEATISLFFYLLFVYLSLSFADGHSWRKAIILGVATGFGILNTPVLFAALPVSFLYLVLLGKNDHLQTLKTIFLIMFIGAIIVSPWMVRNYLIFNKVVFKNSAGVTFWYGNNKFANGTESYPFTPIEYFYNDPEIRKAYPFVNQIESLNEAERDELFQAEAIAFIKNNPAKAVVLVFKKAFFFWILDPYKVTSTSPKWQDQSVREVLIKLYFLTNILFVLLLLISIFLLYRSRGLDIHRMFVLLFCLSISSVYIMSAVGMIRFKLPLEPFVQMFSMYTLSFLLRR